MFALVHEGAEAIIVSFNDEDDGDNNRDKNIINNHR